MIIFLFFLWAILIVAVVWEFIKNKLLKKELLQTSLRFTELDKLKDEFLSLTSHELRTPMTAIKSYLWMALAGKGGALTEKQRYYLDRAYNSTDKLIKLVNDMLNVSRIESGRIAIELKNVKLDVLVNDVITELTPRAAELGIALSVTCPIELPEVLADADRIKEVLMNLLGNSLKFTPRGGKITIALRQNDGMIETGVADSGSGINKQDLPRLFRKFGIVGDNYLQKKNTQGTGLGLYLSKSIIELHGGKIWAQSEGEEKGTTFIFSLKILGA